MKQRFIRVGDELADEVTVVVRGVLDADLLRADALRNYATALNVFAITFAGRLDRVIH